MLESVAMQLSELVCCSMAEVSWDASVAQPLCPECYRTGSSKCVVVDGSMGSMG